MFVLILSISIITQQITLVNLSRKENVLPEPIKDLILNVLTVP